MYKTTHNELVSDVIPILHSLIEQHEPDNINIVPQVRLSRYPILAITTNEPTLGGYHADIVIEFEISWSPDLENVHELNRWFPNNQMLVPLGIIEIKTHDFKKGSTSSDHLSYIRKPALDDLLKIVIYPKDVTDISNSIGSDNYFEVSWNISGDNDEKKDVFQRLLPGILHRRKKDIFQESMIEYYISEFNPEVFHFSEVLSSYQENSTKIVILLLAVFFEGYLKELVNEKIEELSANPHAARINKNWNFKQNLDSARFFGLITDNEYRIIDSIRNARNTYAHELDAFHQTYTTDAEETGTVEEAIQLYEDLIGVRESMIE